MPARAPAAADAGEGRAWFVDRRRIAIHRMAPFTERLHNSVVHPLRVLSNAMARPRLFLIISGALACPEWGWVSAGVTMGR